MPLPDTANVRVALQNVSVPEAFFKVLIRFAEELLQEICIICLSVIQTAAAVEPKMSVSRAAVVIVCTDGRWGQTPVIAAPLLPNNFLF